MILNNKT